MITYSITIFSKNKQAIKFFLLFLTKIKQPKINILINYTQQKTFIKKFTILKSPHVNKKSQRHFEYRLFSKKILISSFSEIKILILLKNFKTKLFSEIKFKINFILKKKISTNNILNPKNYFINSFKKKFITKNFTKKIQIKTIKPCNKTKNYLKVLDCYGELNMQNFLSLSLNSSVG